jgi:hypothetical protein
LDYRELPALLPSFRQHFLEGFIETRRERLPLLEEVLERLPGAAFNIEIKGAQPAHVQIVGDILRKHKCAGRVTWGAVDKSIQRLMVNSYP